MLDGDRVHVSFEGSVIADDGETLTVLADEGGMVWSFPAVDTLRTITPGGTVTARRPDVDPE